MSQLKIKCEKVNKMKRYIYTIDININKFFALEYNQEEKEVDTILLPLLHDGENQGSFLYRNFYNQEEAKLFLNMLSYFCTSSEIIITVDKEIINEKNIVEGNKKIAKFNLTDENYPLEKIKDFYNDIDWDIEVNEGEY
jgi:hypothetical protein